MNLVDTCGWIEYLSGTENRKNFKTAILDYENLIVPTIVLFEVFKWCMREYDRSVATHVMAELKQAYVVDLDESIALYAAELSSEKKLPTADAIIYATGLMKGATILTQDNHFEGLAGVQYFKKA